MRAMIWVVVGVTALMAVIGLSCGYTSKQVSESMRQEALGLVQAVKAGNRETAMTGTLQLAEKWQDTRKLLCLWVNHQDLDAVSVGLQQLKVSVEAGETYHALLYLAELDEALALIYSGRI